MIAAEWRALLEAFVARRIGADAFVRRFLDGWRANRDANQPNPRAIEDLFFVVEAYSPDPEFRKPGEADEGELEEAARRTLAQLREEGAPIARTYDRARAREEVRRFQVSLNRLAGFGCAIAFVWVALCLLQIFAVSDQVQTFLGWSAAPATFAGVFVAFIPFIGNVIAFFGAKDVWDWPAWTAALVFFAAPAATMLSAWLRWARRPPV